MIFHVRGVVMIRHDHGSPAIAAWNDDNDIPLMRGPSWLFSQPLDQEKSKSVSQRNGNSPAKALFIMRGT